MFPAGPSYVQLVFTIPKMLRPYFLWDRSLYGDLCRLAYASTLDFLRAHFPDLGGAVPAMVISPQSFGNLLNWHPHLHSVASLGLFDTSGNFHAAPNIDFSPLEEIFRQSTLRMMVDREKISSERADMLKSWVHSGFQVNADRRVEAGDQAGLESLLEYMERAPVSLERLAYRDDGMVIYRGKFNPSLKTDHLYLTGLDFMAKLVPHILLRYECVIRCYGALSTTIRRKFGWITKDGSKKGGANSVVILEGQVCGFVKVRRRSWARLIQKVWLQDPEKCPRCGKPMKVISALSSPAQDDVIEKILKSRGVWDPPWLRNRPARGPPSFPRETSFVPRSGQTRIEYDEGYVPGREDWIDGVDPDWPFE